MKLRSIVLARGAFIKLLKEERQRQNTSMNRFPRVSRLTSLLYTFLAAPFYTKLGVGFFLVGFVLTIVSLGSSYWEHAENEIGSSHSGLWKVCILGKCDYFINHEIWAWFHAVQGLMLASFSLQTVGTALWVTSVSSSLLERYKRNLRVVRCVVTAVCASLTLVAVSVYGAFQGGSKNFDTLSWGFTIAVISVFFHLASSFFFIIRVRKVVVLDRKNQTPLISPASSTISLNDEELNAPEEQDIPLRLRGSGSESQITSGSTERTSFTLHSVVLDTFTYEDV